MQRQAQVLLWLSPALVSCNYIIARAASGDIAPHLLALTWMGGSRPPMVIKL